MRPAGGVPSVAMVTPSYQQADYLDATIRSVLDQGYPALQYAVQDGGSTDGSVDILERHRPRLTRVESRPDGGQADAINAGFAHTTGEIMGWLNSDDLLLPATLAIVGTYFARHPEIDVVYGHRIVIDDAGREVGRWRLPADTHAYLAWADYVPQETLFWRRSLWDRVGGALDSTMHFAIDWELLIRFAGAGGRFARIPAALGAFRVHADSKTTGHISGIGDAEMASLRRAALGREPTAGEIHRALRPLYVRAWLMAQEQRVRRIQVNRRRSAGQ